MATGSEDVYYLQEEELEECDREDINDLLYEEVWTCFVYSP
jgi:hypothetical protein